MKMKVVLLVVLLLFSANSYVIARSSNSNVDPEKAASNLVSQCADINVGDMVLVSGETKNLELHENIAINVIKKSAFPLLTVGFGNNMWAGGDNNANTGMNFFLPGCTVKLDGKSLVEEGSLKM